MTLIKSNHSVSPFDHLLSSILSDEPANWSTAYSNRFGRKPAVNVEENDDAYILNVSAPGMKRDQFKVELENDVLTIAGEVKEENENKDKHFTMREFSLDSFSRSFNLPEGKVDDSKIEARYEDGVLRIALPKREEYKPTPAKMIEIK